MPFGILLLVVNVALAVHVVRTGRPMMWLWIILFVPGIGSLVYLLAELLPSAMGSRPARRATTAVGSRLTAERDFRRLQAAAEDLPTADNRRRLAEALIERGDADAARRLYESALQPPHETDPALLMGLARCQFLEGRPQQTLDTLDRLLEFNPEFESHDGHLLYARALDAAGRVDEALAEYATLAVVFPGEEARVRHALLLRRLGRRTEAAALIDETNGAMRKGNRTYRRRNQQWVDLLASDGG